MQIQRNHARKKPMHWFGSKCVTLLLLTLLGILFSSDESGTFGTTTKLMNFYVDAPCSITVYLDITPRIECFYADDLADNHLHAEVLYRYDSQSHRITRDIFDLINHERAKKSLRLLVWREDLHQVATSHSIDMQVRSYFAHKSPDGTELNDRLIAANIGFISCGECIYMTNCSGSSVAKRAVTGWMNSPGHRAIILSEILRSGAVGVAYDGDFAYVTLDCIRIRE